MFFSILVMAGVLGAGCLFMPAVQAQGRSDQIAGAVSRLKNNPRYQGSVLGTHVVRSGRGYLYEVRILRPNDTIILVYIDPQTGGVVGDSGRRRDSRGRGRDRIRGRWPR